MNGKFKHDIFYYYEIDAIVYNKKVETLVMVIFFISSSFMLMNSYLEIQKVISIQKRWSHSLDMQCCKMCHLFKE